MSKLRSMRRRQGFATARMPGTIETAVRTDLARTKKRGPGGQNWDETEVQRDAAPITDALRELEPVTRQYYTVLVYMDLFARPTRALPEAHLLEEKIERARRDHGATGDLDDGYFYAWSLLGATHPLTGETIGDVFAEVVAPRHDDDELSISIPELTTALNDSHLALVEHAGAEEEIVIVRDVVTGALTRCFVGAPVGMPGDFFLTWLLPPPPGESYGMSLSDWYAVVEGRGVWCDYFERALASIDAPDREAAYRALMQDGLDPHGDRYWLDYLYRSSAGSERGEVKFCLGLPPI